MITPEAIIFYFDMVGTVACSVSGTILARSKNFDPMGCILVAMVTAIGGGTVRDLMLDRHPLFWMTDMSYFVVITLTSLLFQRFFHASQRLEYWLKITDAVGLAAFSLIGVKVALNYHMNYPVAVLMGIVTIIVGGMIRDMICNEIPLVLRKEIYITASMVGACVYFLVEPYFADWLAEVLMMATIFLIRMLAINYDWHLPPLRRDFS